MTTDTLAAETFYCDVFGWGARNADLPDRRYTMMTVDGTFHRLEEFLLDKIAR